MLSPSQHLILYSRRKKTGYSPFDLPSTSYLDARIGSSITIGTGVSQWTSQSGNVNYTEAVGSAQPLYNLTGLDGNPAVVFDGVNDKLSGTIVGGGTVGNEGLTLIFIVKTSGTGFLFGWGSGSSYIWTGSGSTFEVSNGTGFVSGKNIAGGWLNNNKAKIVIWRIGLTHASNQVLVNGVLKSATNGSFTQNPGLVPSAQSFLMARLAAGGFLSGAVSFFNSRPFYMNDSQISDITKFLVKEYFPTAKITTDGLPILDANQDLTY